MTRRCCYIGIQVKYLAAILLTTASWAFAQPALRVTPAAPQVLNLCDQSTSRQFAYTLKTISPGYGDELLTSPIAPGVAVDLDNDGDLDIVFNCREFIAWRENKKQLGTMACSSDRTEFRGVHCTQL